jgi:hypothetical protein
MLVKRLTILLGIVVVALSTPAQQTSIPPSPTAPVRDPQAIAVVQSAIAAMGGVGVASGIQDLTIQGTSTDMTGASGQTIGFTWRNSGVEFRQELQQAGTTVRISLSGHGTPRDFRNGTWESPPYHESRANLPYYVPIYVLFGEINNPSYTLSYVGSTTIGGRAAIQIHACDESDFFSHLVLPQDWYFDPVSGLPLQVNFKIPSDTDAATSQAGSIQFANFQSVSGVAVPFQITLQEGVVSSTQIVSSVQFNTGISPSEFDPPASAGAQ